MLASLTSTILVAGILGFLLVGSGVLVWDGLAAGHGATSSGEARRAHGRLAVGVIAFAVTLWVALGMLSRAW